MLLKGRCHCGAIAFEAEAPTEVASCNCSICRRRAALWAYYPAEEVSLSVAPGALGAYQCADRILTSHFCNICGCATHNDNPALPDGPDYARRHRITLNARMFDDFDLDAVPVRRIDGKSW